MSSNTLTWMLKLDDKFSGPAVKAGKAVLALQEAINGQVSALEKQGKLLEGVSRTQTALNKSTEKAVALEKKRTVELGKMRREADKAGRALQKMGKHSGGAGLGGLKGGKAGGGGSDGGIAGAAGGISKGSLMTVGALGAVGVAAAGFAVAAKKVFDGFTLMSRGAAKASKWALGELQFKESNLATLETLLGTKQGADDVFGQAMGLANKTPFAAGTVVKGFRKLLGAGFKQDELSPVFQAIGDVAAMNDFDENVIDRMTDTFAQIMGRGKFVTEELKQAFNAGGGLITIKGIYEEIAKSMDLGVDEVEKVMQRGEVSAKTGINAILKVIQGKSGGQVGAGMLRQSQTLGGLLSTLKDAPSAMLYNLDLDKSAGFGAVKGTVQNLVTLFDATNESGQRVQAQLLGMFDTLWTRLFGDLSGEAGLARLEGVVGKVCESVAGVWNLFMSGVELSRGVVIGFLDGIGMSFGKLGNPEDLRRAGESIGNSLATIAKAAIWFAEKLAKVASTFGKLAAWWNDDGGDREGTNRSAITDVGDFLLDSILPESIAAWARDREWEHRQAMRRGATAHAEGGIVSRPTRALVGEAGPEAIIPLSRSHGEGLSHLRGGLGGGNTVTVNVSLALDARGNDDEAGLAQRIAAMLPSAIADALESLSLETVGAI